MKQQIQIKIDETGVVPIYKQITEQIKQSIANNRLHVGERLPTVRELANSLQINTGTVVRAYLELTRQKIIVSHRCGGTTVVAYADGPEIQKGRHQRLASMVNDEILEALSMGYSPAEIEGMYSTMLSHWREERRGSEIGTGPAATRAGKNTPALTIVASHDIALNILIDKFKAEAPDLRIELNYAGSLGGLIALQEHRADMAGIHLLDGDTGEYNYGYIKHLLPGRELAVVQLGYRIQGIMFAKNNPKNIKGLDDLRRPDITFINRQSGSGTRVLLDFELHRCGISPTEVKGYEHEVDTHDAVAVAISRGEADMGIGIEAAAQSGNLDFLPVTKERYDLVLPLKTYKSKMLAPLVRIIKSSDFKEVVTGVGGYDTSQTGTVTFLE